ncbi:MAG: efflux RND transporter periplasmic adaptor subunit [Sandaracinaceae bacterium]
MTRRLALVLALSACGSPADSTSSTSHPATVTNPVPESELTTVTLTDRAVERLGIETGSVEETTLPRVRVVGAEVIVPPGRALPVTAPVAGVVRLSERVVPGARLARGDELLRLVPLAPVDRDTRARATREVEAAQANLSAAESRLERTETLARQRAGSQRAIEEATASRDIARADLSAAQARARSMRSAPLLSDVSMVLRAPDDGLVRVISVASDQAVAAGAPLVELAAVESLWVRVPVASSDLHRLVADAPARVSELGDSQLAATGRAIPGPPTASPLAGTVDRYFALDEASSMFVMGERVLAELTLDAGLEARTVPWSSILYDASGDAWVYACEGPTTFRRARVGVERRAGERAVIRRGPDVGACVVSVGAAMLYGSEFAPGH